MVFTASQFRKYVHQTPPKTTVKKHVIEKLYVILHIYIYETTFEI